MRTKGWGGVGGVNMGCMMKPKCRGDIEGETLQHK